MNPQDFVLDLYLQNPAIFATRKSDGAVSALGGKGLKIYIGAVAQLVEQRTENPCVGGSIPPHTTYYINKYLIIRYFFVLL